MHFSAKRGIAIACRLSVRLSVCLSLCDVGELWSHRLEFFENNLTCLECSLFATPTWRSAPRGTPPKFGSKVTHPPIDLSVGDIRLQIAQQIAQRSQWRAYRKPPSLFLMVPSLTPYDLPFPQKLGFHMPPTYANGHISATGNPIHFMFGSIGWGFRGRRIERRYLRSEQIQDGGRRHLQDGGRRHLG